MPYPIYKLIQGRGEPAIAKPNDTVSSAIAVMVEHDYSQLPVVDESFKPLGMITYQSIVAAMDYFRANADELRVSHATVKSERFSPEDDLFDLLDRLEDKYAILIVNREQRLVGIVTTYDSTAYFRQRAEDMMLVEDIETMVKDLILAAYGANGDDANQGELSNLITQMTDHSGKLRNQYEKALREYLTLTGHASAMPLIEKSALDASFAKFGAKKTHKQFHDLSLADYIVLLLLDQAWQYYADTVKLGKDSIRRLLHSVREMRNSLAHFRGELSPAERDQLRFCWNWLKQIQPEIRVDWSQPQTQAAPEVVVREAQAVSSEQQAEATIEYQDQLGSNESKYAALALFLYALPGQQDRLSFSFEQIEQIMGAPLPPSAREHRNWWANDSVSHVQSQQWLDAGWRVAQINMAEGVVTFARIREREKAYIDFFAKFLVELKAANDLPIAGSSPDGTSFLRIAPAANGPAASLNYMAVFARNRAFRIELYIDTGDAGRNKAIFDKLLAQRGAVEAKLGVELSWERLDAKRASRIAWHHPGNIQDDPEQLAALRRWAVDASIRFRRALDDAIAVAAIELPRSNNP